MAKNRKKYARVNEEVSLPMRAIKISTAIIVAVSLIVGTAFGIDARYASAESVKRLSSRVEAIALTNRKAFIEDKIFELDQQPKLTSQQNAIRKRYERQLQEVNEKLRELEKK